MKLKLILFIAILLLMQYAGWAQSIQMRVCKKDGTVHMYNIEDIRKLTFFLGNIGINDQQFNTVVKNFNLLKNYPNPFNNCTTISYSLPSDGTVEIVILDLNGKIIQTLPGGNQSFGEHTVKWDGIANTGKKAMAGIYFCKVKFNDQIQTTKMLLID